MSALMGRIFQFGDSEVFNLKTLFFLCNYDIMILLYMS